MRISKQLESDAFASRTMSSGAATNNAKKVLRTEIKLILAKISLDERKVQSNIIFRKLLNNKKFVDSKRIAVYLSLDEEVDTRSILEYCLNSRKVCFIPKYDSRTRHMDMVKLHSIDDFNSLPLTPWGIKQPTDENREEALTTGSLDVILVPGLGFTSLGDRIGRGRGYYDAYLQRCDKASKKPYLIGLAFKQQIFESIPTNSDDVKLDEVITP